MMPSLSSPTQSMDTVYPEPMSRLHRRVVPKKRKGGSMRYRTQPVTFSEIQEVDEDNIEDTIPEAASSTAKSELNLLNQRFEAFKRTRDQMLSSNSGSKSTDDTIDVNKNPVSFTVCRTTSGRLPSRPSF